MNELEPGIYTATRCGERVAVVVLTDQAVEEIGNQRYRVTSPNGSILGFKSIAEHDFGLENIRRAE